jgi:hypothetical protein
MKKRYKTTVFFVDPQNFDKENVIRIPYYDINEYRKTTENIIKNNEYSDAVYHDTINNIKNRFLETSKNSYLCPDGDKECCKKHSPQSDYEYTNCIRQKKIKSVKIIEIIFIILLFFLLIKVNYNVYKNG